MEKKLIMKRRDLLWYLAFTIFIIYSMISNTFFYQYIYNIISYKSVLVISFTILMAREYLFEKYNIKLLLSGIFMFVLVFISSHTGLTSITVNIMCIILFSYTSRNIKFEDIAIFSAKLCFVTLIIIVLCSKMGVIDDYIFYQDGRNRHSLGFLYALYPSSILFNVVGLYIYAKKETIKFTRLFLFGAINQWIFALTNSRMNYYTVAILLIVALVLKYIQPTKMKSILWRLMTIIYPVCFALSLYSTIEFGLGAEWAKSLNTILGGRLRFGYASLIEYGVSYFGQKISMSGSGLDIFGNLATGTYTWVDSMYIQLIQRFGIVLSVVILCIMTLVMFKYLTRKNYWMLIILSVFALHGIIDDLILYIHCNTFWIAVGGTIINYVKDYRSNKNYLKEFDKII